ncbi:hypothetical protein BV033_00961 [Haemophilus influenzae]|nr:hypothetical protein BV065_01425 [Haemophilus influenzae]PRL84955.1 hypothetical protein BV033_00961 [Haemophilus influenzae]
MVNLASFAVIVTALPEILPTVRVSPVAVSVTEPELDSILPLMLPVLVVIFTSPELDLIPPWISLVTAVSFTLPVVALMVVSALVSILSDAVIFTVL